jgi:ubiquinone/menaquinone biosynthesis C-methylase UbiE
MDGFLGRLDRALANTSPARIIEVGMGEGMITDRVRRRFPQACVMGLDLEDRDLQDSWRRNGLSGVIGDACRLPFADKSADLVLAIEVLEHLHDPGAALVELARVSRDRVVVSVPLEPLWRIGNLARRRYVSDWGNTPGHLQHWSRRGFASLVARHLEVLEVHQPLPWTMVVARSR